MKKIIFIALLFVLPLSVFAYTPEQEKAISDLERSYQLKWESQVDMNNIQEQNIAKNLPPRKATYATQIQQDFTERDWQHYASVQASNNAKLTAILTEKEVAVSQLKSQFDMVNAITDSKALQPVGTVAPQTQNTQPVVEPKVITKTVYVQVPVKETVTTHTETVIEQPKVQPEKVGFFKRIWRKLFGKK